MSIPSAQSSKSQSFATNWAKAAESSSLSRRLNLEKRQQLNTKTKNPIPGNTGTHSCIYCLYFQRKKGFQKCHLVSFSYHSHKSFLTDINQKIVYVSKQDNIRLCWIWTHCQLCLNDEQAINLYQSQDKSEVCPTMRWYMKQISYPQYFGFKFALFKQVNLKSNTLEGI